MTQTVFIPLDDRVELCKQILKDLRTDFLLPNKIIFPDREFTYLSSEINFDTVVLFATKRYNPNSFFYEIATYAALMKEKGAKRIIVIAPYLYYSRQCYPKDDDSKNYAIGLELLKTNGVDTILTLDLHGEINNPPLEIVSIKTQKYLKEFLINKKNAIVVSPDAGGRGRAENLSNILALPSRTFVKQRKDQEVVMFFDGEINQTHAIIIDDILSTGETIIKCIEILKEKGVKSFDLVLTHLVSKKALKHLLNLYHIETLYIINSLEPIKKDPRIKVVNLEQILKDGLRELLK